MQPRASSSSGRVHRQLGGKLKVLVSGGSALRQEVHDAFRGLGFDLTEGYGLTEAAPVLAVTPPGRSAPPEASGRALPGIELKHRRPDAAGVGEVLARGPERDARATSRNRRGHRARRSSRTAGCTPAISASRRRGPALPRRPAEGRHPRRQRQEHLPRRARGAYSAGAPRRCGAVRRGLPDGRGGETVACLAVPDSEAAAPTARASRAAVEEHFRRCRRAAVHPPHQASCTSAARKLPRTSTRKVKRALVVEGLQQLERSPSAVAAGGRARARGAGASCISDGARRSRGARFR